MIDYGRDEGFAHFYYILTASYREEFAGFEASKKCRQEFLIYVNTQVVHSDILSEEKNIKIVKNILII